MLVCGGWVGVSVFIGDRFSPTIIRDSRWQTGFVITMIKINICMSGWWELISSIAGPKRFKNLSYF